MKRLSHAVRDRRLVESLVRLHSHFDFVAHAHQQEAPLGTVDRHLTNQLVERLRVQLLSDRTDSRFARLSLLQLLVELVLQIYNVDAGGRRRRNVLDPQLA